MYCFFMVLNVRERIIISLQNAGMSFRVSHKSARQFKRKNSYNDRLEREAIEEGVLRCRVDNTHRSFLLRR